MRIAWATDIHLDCVEREDVFAWCKRLQATQCEALLIGGDIAMADDFIGRLQLLESRLSMPIYFVLGNHDYYGGSVASVRRAAREARTDTLMWLPDAGVVDLGEGHALVGHGGWGDARLGDFLASPVILNDYFLIQDLKEAGEGARSDPLLVVTSLEHKAHLQQALHRLGDDAADSLRPHLEQAVATHEHVWVLTHVPPFREACWYDGKISTADWLPGFACKAVGDMLMDVVARQPKTLVTVLCGHTHGEGQARLLPNLRVLTAGAEYGKPSFRVLTG